MKLTRTRKLTSGIALLGVVALTAACGDSDNGDSAEEGGDLSGEIAGSGASSMERAQGGWIAGFNEVAPDVTVNYDPTGSSTGREQFLSGSVQFAGSDSALKAEEIETANTQCGGEALELPLYISPIAVVYNLPNVDTENLRLTPEVIARLFTGQITNWNDPAIQATNEGVTLPDLPVVPVNRSDGSGTTENFQLYLQAAAPDAWPHEPSDSWPITGTQGAAQTSGMFDVVSGTEGAIGYIDASRAEDLGTVAVGVGDDFVPFSPEAAAAVVDASERTSDATEKRLTIELARDTDEAGAYPIVLISYTIACDTYEDASDAANVAAYLRYVASEEGQDRAAEPDVAGSAPISDALRTEIEAAIDTIEAAG